MSFWVGIERSCMKPDGFLRTRRRRGEGLSVRRYYVLLRRSRHQVLKEPN